MSSSNEYESDPRPKKRSRMKSKRTRSNTSKASPYPTIIFSLDPLFELAGMHPDQQEEENSNAFDEVFETYRVSFMEARNRLYAEASEYDEQGRLIRPMMVFERSRAMQQLDSIPRESHSSIASVFRRKLNVQREKNRASLHRANDAVLAIPSETSQPMDMYTINLQHNTETVSALESLHLTLYEQSFASRLLGSNRNHHEIIHRDWQMSTPWLELLSDIRAHYALAHPEREQPLETAAPIDYVVLDRTHLPQVHDLLSRNFWPGVDVSDCLQQSPSKCTVVATYKRLVVGAAFLNAPDEAYLTYLVVRAGWENSGIATLMLHHLVMVNPKRDITLHVSANNPAMLLYNRFGFKAEEFIVGFYEDYLDRDSRACKNAFRLRLRR